MMDDSESTNNDIAALEEHIRNEQAELEDINAMIMRIEKDLSKNENERAWIERIYSRSRTR